MTKRVKLWQLARKDSGKRGPLGPGMTGLGPGSVKAKPRVMSETHGDGSPSQWHLRFLRRSKDVPLKAPPRKHWDAD